MWPSTAGVVAGAGPASERVLAVRFALSSGRRPLMRGGGARGARAPPVDFLCGAAVDTMLSNMEPVRWQAVPYQGTTRSFVIVDP